MPKRVKKSALDKIKDIVQKNPEAAAEAFEYFKSLQKKEYYVIATENVSRRQRCGQRITNPELVGVIDAVNYMLHYENCEYGTAAVFDSTPLTSNECSIVCHAASGSDKDSGASTGERDDFTLQDVFNAWVGYNLGDLMDDCTCIFEMDRSYYVYKYNGGTIKSMIMVCIRMGQRDAARYVYANRDKINIMKPVDPDTDYDDDGEVVKQQPVKLYDDTGEFDGFDIDAACARSHR